MLVAAFRCGGQPAMSGSHGNDHALLDRGRCMDLSREFEDCGLMSCTLHHLLAAAAPCLVSALLADISDMAL